MKRLKLIFVFFLILFALIVLTGCESEEEQNILKDKNLAEMEYLENEILSIAKNYMDGDYFEKDSLNWEDVSRDFKKVADSIDVIIIDLTSLEIDNNDVMDLQAKVNDVNYAISEKSEGGLLVSISNLYSLIPKYIKQYNSDNVLVKTKQIKSNLLNGVTCAFLEEYGNGLNYIIDAEKVYNELIQNQEYLKDNSYKVNKNYVEIEQLKIAVEDKKIDSIFDKYLDTLDMFD